MAQTIHVSTVSGDFPTIGAALNSIPADNATPVTIEIAPGVYREKLTINKPYVTLLGLGGSSSDTVLTYDDYANALMENGEKYGTFRSYSVFIDTHDVTLQNLTIENASGDSKTHGQAIALYADGDRLVLNNCRLLGHQDTLFTGPLPPMEIKPGGFIGPKQFAPRINGRHYYKDCYICGDIDFIFGSATAYFENCTIESLCRTLESSSPENIQGYATAASTPEGQEYGYVFSRCRFTTDCCPEGSVYLGRPWRDYAKTVLINCELGSHIHPAGFHDWNKEKARDTVFYAEYNSCPSCETKKAGCEAGQFPRRASFCLALDSLQAEHFSKEKVLGGTDGWLPIL